MKRISLPAHVSKLAVSALVLAGLSGCGSIQPLPSDTFYRLNIVPKVDARSDGQIWTDKTVRVAKFRASGVHRERAIAYTESDQVVVKQHRYHLWIDSPERILQNELVRYLRAVGVAPAITASDLGNDGFVIQGQIHQMDHVISADGARVVVAVAFELVQQDSGKALVLGTEYRESRPTSGSDMTAVAAAISDAVGIIFEQFVTDAGDALNHRS